jgi:hypothetical protein
MFWRKAQLPEAYAANKLIELDYRPEGDSRKLREFITTHGALLTAWTFFGQILWVAFFSICSAIQYSGSPTIISGYMFLQTFCSILMLVFVPVSVWASYRLAKVFAQPTHLLLDDQSVWTQSRQMSSKRRKKLFDWKELVSIDLESPLGQTSKEDQIVVFETRSGGRAKLKLGGLHSSAGRSKLLECIRNSSPNVRRSPDLMPLLEKQPDHSYTELWLSALSAPPRLQQLMPLSQGRQLKAGKYTILKKLGSGGQGSAYLAVNNDAAADKTGTEEVVLKEYVLPVQVARASKRQSLQTLENETRILEKLSHPQIVALIDYFVEDHRGYLVLEHIDGVTLRAYVNEHGAMAEPRVCELALQLCQILTYLHEQTPPVVHRDFTPDNLMITDSGTPKLIDFNVAQQTSETVTATVVGKHAYLPPEQFRGKAVPASDIYALGATLSFLLTAKEPEPLSVSHPRADHPAVSESMDLIVSHATQLDATGRPMASELHTQLSELSRYLSFNLN